MNPDRSRAGRRHIDPWLVGALGIYSVLMLPHLRFVPIWDGRLYYECLRHAMSGGFHPLDFNCFAHPSMLYMVLLSIGQYLDPGSAVALNLTNILLGAMGIVAFWALAEALFPGSEQRTERGLLTLLYSVCPVVLASVLNPGPDTGVLVFSLLYAALLLRRKFGLAVAAAIFLVSSKESGILLYPIITVLFFGIDFLGRRVPGKTAVREVLRRTAYFAPVFFSGAVALLQWATGRPIVWEQPGRGNGSILREFLLPRMAEIIHNTVILSVFVVNFDWLLVVVLAAAVCRIGGQIVRKRFRVPVGVEPDVAMFVVLLFLAMLYALTRFPTFTNLRYVLPIFPFLLLTFALAWRIIAPQRKLRLAGVAVMCILFVISARRTVDPVSEVVFGTFDFGRHRLLNITLAAGECCGHGRDQLAYNLEYTRFASIQDEIYGALRPSRKTPIVTEDEADWYLQGRVDDRTFRRTLDGDHSFRPRYLPLTALLEMRPGPERIFFVAYPNIPTSPNRVRLMRDYSRDEALSFGEGGYEIPVFRMTRRGAPEGSR
jgi:hypothetical protein